MLQADEPALFQTEREHLLVQLIETESERDFFRAQLLDALRLIEYWRSMSEYHEKMCAEHRDGVDGGREPRAARDTSRG